jgi:hypothetical protein
MLVLNGKGIRKFRHFKATHKRHNITDMSRIAVAGSELMESSMMLVHVASQW